MTSTRGDAGLLVKGVALLAVLASVVALSIAIYNKQFTSSVQVTAVVDRAGLQLNTNGDVRMRGVLIGRVTGTKLVGGRAHIGLALSPGAAARIPADVTARVLPTTLFGQKYVELLDPLRPSAKHLAAGQMIAEDTSKQTVELTDVLGHVDSLLKVVDPADVSIMLGSIANGVRGRGEEIKSTITKLGSYLTTLDTALPQLKRDLSSFARVAQIYADAAPDILRITSGATSLSKTVVAYRTQLAALWKQLTSLATTTRALLVQNGDRIIDASALVAPIIEVLAKYSPEFPCVFQGLILGEKAAAAAFHQDAFNGNLHLGAHVPGYTAADKPKLGDTNLGPSCAGLPKITHPLPAPVFDDGIN